MRNISAGVVENTKLLIWDEQMKEIQITWVSLPSDESHNYLAVTMQINFVPVYKKNM